VRSSIFARSVCGIVALTLAMAAGAAFGQEKDNADDATLGEQKATPSETPRKKLTRLMPPLIDAKAAGAKAIEMFDANKDGKLSGKELDKCPGLKAALAEVDPNGQGEITADMIAKRIQAWIDTKLGRASVACTVLHNGKPMDGASVRFVPEKFLGKNMTVGSGKTDKNGVAMISIEISGPQDLPGVAPGLYRVEITKDGEKIPAKYNTKTTLGQEIAMDAHGMHEGIKCDLDY
jgi:hypothetical protein